ELTQTFEIDLGGYALLAAEVMVKTARACAGGCTDHVDGGRLDTMLREAREGGPDDALAAAA
ncbi:MAG: hypothetical protein VW625_07410, partial [Perlucidibaca sp.]